MSFTYDLSATGDSLIVSRIRLEIGDTDSGTDAGVKPDGNNFTDDELLYFYGEELGVGAASARACEVLARMWAGAGGVARVREYQIDTRQKSADYAKMAADLRSRSGGRFVSGSAPTTRVDGYSSTVNSREQSADNGEYGGKIIHTRVR